MGSLIEGWCKKKIVLPARFCPSEQFSLSVCETKHDDKLLRPILMIEKSLNRAIQFVL